MTKHSNPFYTMGEALAVLNSVGANPLRNLPDELDWRTQVLSVMFTRAYNGSNHYFVVSVHIDAEGLGILLSMIDKSTCPEGALEPVRTKHSEEYDKLAIYLDSEGCMLEVMALVPAEESK